MNFKAVVVGASAGGLRALRRLIGQLPRPMPIPMIVAQHLPQSMTDDMAGIFQGGTGIQVKEAFTTQIMEPNCVYLAPAGYHLLVEDEKTLALNVDEPVQWARPSIDVLFESAAQVYGDALIGVILTGANMDGTQGLKSVADHGGFAIVQDPATAEIRTMPESALQVVPDATKLELDDMGPFIGTLLDRRNAQQPA